MGSTCRMKIMFGFSESMAETLVSISRVCHLNKFPPVFFWGRKKSWEEFLDLTNTPISDPKIPWIFKLFTCWANCGLGKVFHYATMINNHYLYLFKYVFSVFELIQVKKSKKMCFLKSFETLKQTYYHFNPLTIFEKTWIFDISCIISRLVRRMTPKRVSIDSSDILTSEKS